MAIEFRCPSCKVGLKARESMAGFKSKCLRCHSTVTVPIPKPEVTAVCTAASPPPLPLAQPAEVPFPPVFDSPEEAGPTNGGDWPQEFKVLTQKDKWFTQKFDPNRLEEAINAYAHEGWRVCSTATAAFPGFFGANREEVIIVLQRGGPNIVHQYKVLTQKDKWLSQKFDPLTLEKAINAYAQEGWRVAACATASFPGFFTGNREEMIVILERRKS